MRKSSLLKTLFSLLVFPLPFSALHARTLTFPVHGLEVATEEPVPLAVDWDEDWFVTTDPEQYHHGIARIAAMLSEISYVPVEKNPTSNPLLQSYRVLGFKDNDIEWNYVLDYSTPLSGNNQAAYSFAFKEISTPKGPKKLVFVVLRGTPLNANEWISNINVSDTTKKNILVHEGFSKTCENLRQALYDFLKNKNISPKESYFLITGHSRGAALANLLGATIADENIIPAKKLFVYTFASPNVSQEEKTSDPKYNFIWNIINAEDLVPSVPPNRNNWKWKKFGRSKIIANYWNTAPQKYLDDYFPRMNEYYKKLLLRDYAPFKNGPFLQIQLAKVLTYLYTDTESYYSPFFGLHRLAENIFWKVFPDKHEEELGIPQNEEEKLPFLIKMIQKSVNSNIDGGFEYVMNAFVDMHACESYLSWMLALNEEELFSELGSSQIVFSGSHDIAVYNDDGEMLAQILDGSVQLYSLKIPVAVLPLPKENVIGFPGNQNLNVVVHKDSLFPTIIDYEIEHYDAEGKLLSVSKEGHLHPHSGTVLNFKAGEVTLGKESLSYQKIQGKEAKALSKKYDLDQRHKFVVHPEITFSTEKILGLGLRAGCQQIYGSVTGEMHFANSSTYGLALGLGHQHTLYGRIMLDSEIFARFVWAKLIFEDRKCYFVPSCRFSLSYKPRRRVHFFAATVFDLHIDEQNDEIFTRYFRENHFSSINIGSSAELVPSFQFGIRF